MPALFRSLTGYLWHLLQQVFSASLRGVTVLSVIVGITWAAGGNAEKTGDNLQIALPLLAWGCAAVNGDGVEYLGRYAVMFLTAHGMKRAFGDADFNQRPDGGSHGMPSAHTSTAVLGTSRLISDCVSGNPVVQSVAVLGAGFVGASRIDTGAHTIWQVLSGAILGLACDRAFGKTSAVRRWLVGWVRAMMKRRAIAAPPVAVASLHEANPGGGGDKRKPVLA
jgi:membrane-associated phospholipid phosphatase